MAGIALILLGLCLYFLPTVVASGKRNVGAIFILNLLLGWTLIGWVAALVWAFTNDARAQIIVQAQPQLPPQPPVLCSKCGHYSLPYSQFCGTCGASLRDRVTSEGAAISQARLP